MLIHLYYTGALENRIDLENNLVKLIKFILELEDNKKFPTILRHDHTRRVYASSYLKSSRCQACHPPSNRKTGQSCPKLDSRA